MTMLFYLTILAAIWLASYNFLTASRGQKGLDTFFKQFILIASEVVGSLLLLNYFQIPAAKRICLAILAIHTLLLFAYATISLLRFKVKSKNKQLA